MKQEEKGKIKLSFIEKNTLDKKILLCIFYRMTRKTIKSERLKELVNLYHANVSEINYAVRQNRI